MLLVNPEIYYPAGGGGARALDRPGKLPVPVVHAVVLTCCCRPPSSVQGVLNALINIDIPEDVSRLWYFYGAVLLIHGLSGSGCIRTKAASGNSCRDLIGANLNISVSRLFIGTYVSNDSFSSLGYSPLMMLHRDLKLNCHSTLPRRRVGRFYLDGFTFSQTSVL